MKLNKNKNILILKDPLEGDDRREEIMDTILENSVSLPPTVSYEDIDNEMKKWVEEKISINFEDKKIPTMFLLTNQRFSEYSQSWEYVDDNKNLLLNFKTITRQTNPQKGTIYGESYNIPGEHFFKIGINKKLDKDGQEVLVIYEMKQPTSIDFTYTISLFTNKILLINEFNSIINGLFNSLQSYIAPKGHHMSLEILSINDQSDYNIDDRTFFSQSIDLILKAYIIKEDDLRIREIPNRVITIFDGGINRMKKSNIEIEEEEIYICNEEEENKFYYKPLKITINFNYCNDSTKFIIDTDMVITRDKLTNIKKYFLFVNDNEITNIDNLDIKNGDEIKIKIIQNDILSPSIIELFGYDPNTIYDSEDDLPELSIDEINNGEEIIINDEI